MSKIRNGGKSKKGKRNNIQDNDVYFIKPVAEIIFKYLRSHFIHKKRSIILDACANDGVLGESIINSGDFKTVSLYKQDKKYNNESILDYNPGFKFDIIVCNPPWVPVTLPESIYHHLINNLLMDDGVLIFFVNNTFCYQGWERAVNLKYQKYYFLPRYVFSWSGRPLLDCGVMVYHKDNNVPEKALKLREYIHIPKDLDGKFFIGQQEETMFKNVV